MEILKRLDLDNDGYVTEEELTGVLKSVERDGERLADILVEHVLEKVSKNKDSWCFIMDVQDILGRERSLELMAPMPGVRKRCYAMASFSVSEAFAKCSGGQGQGMDGRCFVKMLKDCLLIDERFSSRDADILFAKVKAKGERRIDLVQFEAALKLIADKRVTTERSVRRSVAEQVVGATKSRGLAALVYLTERPATSRELGKPTKPEPDVEKPAQSPRPPASPQESRSQSKRLTPMAKAAKATGEDEQEPGLKPQAPADPPTSRSPKALQVPTSPQRPTTPAPAKRRPGGLLIAGNDAVNSGGDSPEQPNLGSRGGNASGCPARLNVNPTGASPERAGGDGSALRSLERSPEQTGKTDPQRPTARCNSRDPSAPLGSVEKAFKAFCGRSLDMDGTTFAKLVKECDLLCRKLTAANVDLIFAKVKDKGERRIEFEHFEAALQLLADGKGESLEVVRQRIEKSAGPLNKGK